MTDLNQKAFGIVYAMYNRDTIDITDYTVIRQALNTIETLQSRDKELEDLWEEFGDIPMDDETECMEAPFLDFQAGTHREEIWHWFDERHSKGVAYLLYGGAEDYVSETRRLYKLRKKCLECESMDCCFNHGGECRLPLIHEREPRISEEDGCADYTCKEGN